MKGISHISLDVLDIKKSYDFYRKILGCQLEFEDEKTFNLLNAGLPVWIHEGKSVNHETRLRHFAFSVTEKELKEAKIRLDKENIKNSGIIMFMDQYPLIELKDPDGLVLEFFVD